MRVLVCGGRNFSDWQLMFERLDLLHQQHQFTLLIEGGQRGADLMSREWAESRGVPFKQYDADWNKYGPRAGPMRNVTMLAKGEPDLVVAFPGDKGTAHMVSISQRAGKPVVWVT